MLNVVYGKRLSSIVNEVIRRNNFIFFLQKVLRTKKNAKCKQGFHLDDLYALESIKKQLPLINNIKSKTKQVFAHMYIKAFYLRAQKTSKRLSS